LRRHAWRGDPAGSASTDLEGRNEMQTYPVKLASLLELGQPDPADV
jgi:hypothetical protein